MSNKSQLLLVGRNRTKSIPIEVFLNGVLCQLLTLFHLFRRMDEIDFLVNSMTRMIYILQLFLIKHFLCRAD